MEEIRRKRELLWRAVKEAQQKAWKEEEVRAQVWWKVERRLRMEAEAICQVQKAQEDAEFQGKLRFDKSPLVTSVFAELSMNTHPEEDRDYHPEDVMDVDKEATFQKKGKGKAKKGWSREKK